MKEILWHGEVSEMSQSVSEALPVGDWSSDSRVGARTFNLWAPSVYLAMVYYNYVNKLNMELSTYAFQ